MARILTGIQSTGRPHLGNLLGAMLPAIRLTASSDNEALFFIADLHTLTTVQDAALRRAHMHATAAAWLACGLDTERVVFYRQSRVPEVCELGWYLSCLTPYPMLANAHAFKDKAGRMADVSAGLFTYPVLMAADILLYGADVVPVGKDQVQHIEIARDLAGRFNHLHGAVFTLPRAAVQEDIQAVPGTDGQKMSKSYNNTIDVFAPEAVLKKAVMGIATDSAALADRKDPDGCRVFGLYRVLASEEQVVVMRGRYEAGGYGYGAAKKELLGLILDRFAEERRRYAHYTQDVEAMERVLVAGERRARLLAAPMLERVRACLGHV